MNRWLVGHVCRQAGWPPVPPVESVVELKSLGGSSSHTRVRMALGAQASDLKLDLSSAKGPVVLTVLPTLPGAPAEGEYSRAAGPKGKSGA